jgi:hypothetical protein
MPVIPAPSEPENVERHDRDRSEHWHDYSVEFGNERGPIASMPHVTGRGFGPSLVYGSGGWSLHGLSRG